MEECGAVGPSLQCNPVMKKACTEVVTSNCSVGIRPRTSTVCRETTRYIITARLQLTGPPVQVCLPVRAGDHLQARHSALLQ